MRIELRAALIEASAWALATFKDETIEEQAKHLVKEAQELSDQAEGRGAAEEMADVAILAHLILFRVEMHADAQDVDLAEAVRAKLAINRKRRWRRTPDGDYQHVKDGR